MKKLFCLLLTLAMVLSRAACGSSEPAATEAAPAATEAATEAASTDYSAMTIDELKASSDLFDEDVYEAINLENCMALRASYGGPAVSETTRQIEAIEAFVAARNN